MRRRLGAAVVAVAQVLSVAPAAVRPVSADEAVAREIDPRDADRGPDRQGTVGLDELAVGDRLRIAFYSKAAVVPDGGARAGELSGLVEHPDLTGDYVVRLDRAVFVPLIGRIDVRGLDESALAEALERRVAGVLGGAAKVSVRVVEREPIYVTGDVPQPGAFRYSPGMTVLHAAALAGLRGLGPDLNSRVAVLQQSQQLRQAQLRMADLLAHRDVLVAARSAAQPTASEELKDMVGPKDAADRIAAAARVSDLERGSSAGESKGYDEGIGMLEQEKGLLSKSLEEAERSLKFHVARFDNAAQMHGKGVMTDLSLEAIRSQLDGARARWSDVVTALTRVDQRMLELSRQKSKAAAEVGIARERRIDELQAEIRQAAAVRSLLEPALVLGGMGGSRATPRYRIVRRSPVQVDQFDGDRYSPLRPGDVLEVIGTARESDADVKVVGRGY